MLNFLLLLLYSLLPGISKVLGNQSVFALNIPIIILLFVVNKKGKKSFCKFDLIFLYFLFYTILQTLFTLIFSDVNEQGVLMSVYLYLIPFIGFFYSKIVNFNTTIKNIIYIGLIHLIIGVLIYPAFGIGTYFNPYTAILREGTMPDRMNSTSGSLGFGALFMIVFACSCYSKNPLYIFMSCIGVFFSMQRSAWVGAIIISVIFFLSQTKFKKGITRKKIKNLFAFLLLIIIIAVSFFKYLPKLENFNFINDRFSEVSSASDDRTDQWSNGLNVFFEKPFGVGLGQVGQIAARYEKNNLPIISDGDFIRIFVELGIGAIFFYFAVYKLVILNLLQIKRLNNILRIIVALIIGFFIQMIGSNITEFYFTNFLYWVFIGFYFKELENVSKKNKCLSCDL